MRRRDFPAFRIVALDIAIAEIVGVENYNVRFVLCLARVSNQDGKKQ